jgi:predicted Kef-type K+ transport protein
MSLRAFHLLFIGCSAVLAAFLAAWAAGQYRVEPRVGYVAAGVASVACAGALVAYAAAFQRKTRGLS